MLIKAILFILIMAGFHGKRHKISHSYLRMNEYLKKKEKREHETCSWDNNNIN